MRAPLDPDALPRMRSRRARRALIESIVVELLNPKVALFYVAFLPQFVDPTAAMSLWLQLLALGMMANAAFTGADVAAVFLTSRALARLKRHGGAQRFARLVGGSVLIGLGASLAISRD
jgi:threonine/homoserine/homoserine lactone efflux protein